MQVITNAFAVWLLLIIPDVKAGVGEGTISLLVCTVIESVAGMELPILQPKRVTETGTLATSAVPPTVNVMEVLPGALGVMVVPCTETVQVGVG